MTGLQCKNVPRPEEFGALLGIVLPLLTDSGAHEGTRGAATRPKKRTQVG
jgi:hypothetical protein